MNASTTRPFARDFDFDFDFSIASIYREKDEGGEGWRLDRNWNTHPARELEVEQLYLDLWALHHVSLQAVHHVAKKQLVIADGIDPADEVAVAQCLLQLRDLVWPHAPSKEAPDADAS